MLVCAILVFRWSWSSKLMEVPRVVSQKSIGETDTTNDYLITSANLYGHIRQMCQRKPLELSFFEANNETPNVLSEFFPVNSQAI